jgi:hypothetical protein
MSFLVGSQVTVKWSEPHAYDLTRARKRASVPKALERAVPERAGTYVIFRTGVCDASESVIDIGECGPRANSKPCGLRGRLASNVAHSASERIASDITRGDLHDDLAVGWIEATSKTVAKEIQDALICLFRRDFGRQPKYNAKAEYCQQPERFQPTYDALKAVIRRVPAASS